MANISHLLPISGRWFKWTDADARTWPKGRADQLLDLEVKYMANKLSYFLAHGQGNAFLNDRDSDICILKAPNGVGKTWLGVGWTQLRIIPLDKNWECFKHGIKWHQWEGGRRTAMCSYKWMHLKRTLWPMFRELCPDYELGPYSKNYKGRFPRAVNWIINPSVKLECGSQIDFFCYEQDQDVFESSAYDIVHFDEQPREAQFDGMDERMRRVDGKCCVTATLHHVKGREGTGQGGWIDRMVNGDNNKGHTFKVYRIGIKDVPDEILSKEAKEKAYEKHVLIPKRNKDLQAEREGLARYFGETEPGSGLVFPMWNQALHVVDDFPVPPDWTRLRAIDHGESGTTCCLWMAVNKYGLYFVYRELYQKNMKINQICRQIVEMSGNSLVKTGEYEDERAEVKVPVYEERMDKEFIFKTVMDARSSANADYGRTTIDMYRSYGLNCREACAEPDKVQFERIKDLLFPDPALQHPITKLSPAPRLYIFAGCKNLLREIRSFVLNADESKPALHQSVHAIDAWKYGVSENLQYMGDEWRVDEQALQAGSQAEQMAGNPVTGY